MEESELEETIKQYKEKKEIAKRAIKEAINKKEVRKNRRT